MTEADLVRKKLAVIERLVAEIRSLGRPDRLTEDVREQGFVLHWLQNAIQAALDVCSHIVATERMGEPNNNKELIAILVRRRWIPGRLKQPLTDMIGFRNVVVHAYQDVDLEIVRGILKRHLGDLLAFTRAIARKLP